MNASSLARSLPGHVLRFLLPWACAGCRTPLESIEDEGFCGRCWLMIPRIQGTVCRFCGVPLKDGGNLCFTCRQEPAKLLIRAATVYSHPMVPAIHRFKYAGRKTLQQPFRVLLHFAWDQYTELQSVNTLVPVPLHSTNRHERGYNQAELLANVLSAAVGVPVLSKALIRTRRTTPQFKLHRTERLTNLQGSMALSTEHTPSDWKGREVLLIDDVCTTGATLMECAALLKQAGVKRVKALVLARDL